MKAQRTEEPQVYQLAEDGKDVKIFLRENIQLHEATEDQDAYWSYDEYTSVIRNRANIEQYVQNNFDALIQGAKLDEIAQIKVVLEKAIDQYIDKVAKDKGYGREGLSPSAACLGYAAYVNVYQTEAVTYGEWIASLWPVVYQIMSDVETGQREIPTEEELISELPEMVWP